METHWMGKNDIIRAETLPSKSKVAILYGHNKSYDACLYNRNGSKSRLIIVREILGGIACVYLTLYVKLYLFYAINCKICTTFIKYILYLQANYNIYDYG